jgi:hypothetical protein
MDNLEGRLREQRPELTPVELDRVKLRAMHAARSTPRREISMRARLTMVAVIAIVMASGGGAIALIGGSPGENAAETQYGTNGQNGQNGQNGANGQNGFNGQNGAPGTTTIVTITIPANAPLPGTAKPTKTNHKQIRVCKRFSHHSTKFHHNFHPKVCWYRFVS